MIPLNLKTGKRGELTVLCLGAHSDDIEIGCGGTLLQLKSAIPGIRFYWVVFSAAGLRAEEARKAADLFAAGCEKTVVLKSHRDGFLPYSGADIKESFEEISQNVKPDLIFTHWGGDAHQDHRLLSELTWNTFRNHFILEYEVPKYDGDMGRPNLYVPLDAQLHAQKIDFLFEAFVSQSGKKWFDRETFRGLMRLRGMECNSPTSYAEAFHVRKALLRPTAE